MDLLDFKSSRKNLFSFSIFTTLLLIFSNDIEKINFLWIIIVENINQFKILMVLAIINGYNLWRYFQFNYKDNNRNNYNILFKLLTSDKKLRDTVEIKWHWDALLSLFYDNENTIYTAGKLKEADESKERPIYSPSGINIYWNNVIINKDVDTLRLMLLVDWKYSQQLYAKIKKNNALVVYYSIIHCLINPYFFDYILPTFLWIGAIFLCLLRLFCI